MKKEEAKTTNRGRKEAQIAATFYDLEGIVSIRDYFTENKTSYVVMDYVNGISIRNYIRQQGRMNGKDVHTVIFKRGFAPIEQTVPAGGKNRPMDRCICIVCHHIFYDNRYGA